MADDAMQTWQRTPCGCLWCNQVDFSFKSTPKTDVLGNARLVQQEYSFYDLSAEVRQKELPAMVPGILISLYVRMGPGGILTLIGKAQWTPLTTNTVVGLITAGWDSENGFVVNVEPDPLFPGDDLDLRFYGTTGYGGVAGGDQRVAFGWFGEGVAKVFSKQGK